MSLKANVEGRAGELRLGIQSWATKYGSLVDAPGGARPMRYSSLSLKDLVCLCAGDPWDDDAWEEFVSRTEKPIALAIMRTASRWGERSFSEVQDLRQITYIKLRKDGCRRLRDFAIQHPDEAILRYIRKTAANATLDHLRRPIPNIPIDREAEREGDRSQKSIEDQLLLKEIDEHLKRCLTEPDRVRDRTIFWLYFRQGMSCKEIASLPAVGLSAKGVGSVIERSKHCLRERIVGLRVDSEDDKE